MNSTLLYNNILTKFLTKSTNIENNPEKKVIEAKKAKREKKKNRHNQKQKLKLETAVKKVVQSHAPSISKIRHVLFKKQKTKREKSLNNFDLAPDVPEEIN